MVVRQIGTIERKMLRVRERSASRYNALLLDLIVHLILQRVSPVNHGTCLVHGRADAQVVAVV
jgi:hypothetical protein